MLINSPNISGSLTVTGNSVISGSLTVLGSITGAITGSATTASYVEYSNVANKPALVSGSSQITYSGLTGIPSGIVSGSSQVTYSGLSGIPSGIVSGSAQISGFGIFATTGSNQFNGSQAITGSLTTTGTIVAQTLNVQQVTSSIVYSSGSNIFGNSVSNTQQFTGSVGVTGSLTVAGAGTFTGALNGTSALFSGLLSLDNSTSLALSINSSTNNPYIRFQQSGATKFFIGERSAVSGDGGTGYDIYAVAGNDIRFFPGAAKALTLASTGAATFNSTIQTTGLGIGGANNGTQLIYGTMSTTNTVLELNNTNASGYGGYIRAALGGTQYILRLVDQAGNNRFSFYGDGTSNFSGAATFSSSVTTGGNINVNSDGIFINRSSSGEPYVFFQKSGVNRGSIYGVTGGGLRIFDENDNQVLTITGGNVGIGTSSPFAKLEVVGGNNLPPSTGTQNYTIALRDPTSMVAGVGGSILLQGFKTSTSAIGNFAYIAGKKENGTAGNEAGFLSLGTFDSSGVPSERMRITSGGYLKASNTGTYVSTTTPYHELRNNTDSRVVIVSNSSATLTDQNGIMVYFSNAAPNNSTSDFIACEDSSVLRFEVRSNGGIANYQGNDVNLSDERVKKDIEPLESYWDKFKAIEIVKFKYKDQTHDDFNIGVIAQQVEAVAPEFVDVDSWNTKPEIDEEGNEIVSEEEPLKSIYTADLHHATIKVLQEAMSKIEILEAENDTLKSRIDTLEQA